jgi:hypothetical protein
VKPATLFLKVGDQFQRAYPLETFLSDGVIGETGVGDGLDVWHDVRHHVSCYVERGTIAGKWDTGADPTALMDFVGEVDRPDSTKPVLTFETQDVEGSYGQLTGTLDGQAVIGYWARKTLFADHDHEGWLVGRTATSGDLFWGRYVKARGETYLYPVATRVVVRAPCTQSGARASDFLQE